MGGKGEAVHRALALPTKLLQLSTMFPSCDLVKSSVCPGALPLAD